MNCPLKHVIEGNIRGMIEMTEDEEKDGSSCWMAISKGEDTGG
jgi:hypothetical protein